MTPQLKTAVSILVALTVFGSTSLFAQEPCIPDCPNDLFTGNYVVFVPAPAPYQTCLMEVRYKTRKACGIYNDVQVISIAFAPGPGCSALTTWFAGASVAEKGQFMSKSQNLASIGAIKQEFTSMYNQSSPAVQATLECPGGTSIWRAAKGSCWFVDSDCWNTVMKPCSNDACCLHNYDVCMGSSGPEMTLTSSVVPSQPCDEPVNPGTCAYVNAEGDCFFTCDNDGIEDVLGNSAKEGGDDPNLSNAE